MNNYDYDKLRNALSPEGISSNSEKEKSVEYLESRIWFLENLVRVKDTQYDNLLQNLKDTIKSYNMLSLGIFVGFMIMLIYSMYKG